MKKILCVLMAVMLVACLCACGDIQGSNNSVGGDTQGSSSSVGGDATTSQNEDVNVTMGQKNALKKAKTYLNTMPFSKKGLISQLEFEGFSTEEATYGAENCGADWKEQAAKKAKSYLDLMAFSCVFVVF